MTTTIAALFDAARSGVVGNPGHAIAFDDLEIGGATCDGMLSVARHNEGERLGRWMAMIFFIHYPSSEAVICQADEATTDEALAEVEQLISEWAASDAAETEPPHA